MGQEWYAQARMIWTARWGATALNSVLMVWILTRLARIRKAAHRHCSSRTSASGLRRQ